MDFKKEMWTHIGTTQKKIISHGKFEEKFKRVTSKSRTPGYNPTPNAGALN